MQRLIWTVLVAFASSIALGPILIPWLKKMKFGQTIYDLGPESHKVKQGVPTMGGLIFAPAFLLAPLIFAWPSGRGVLYTTLLCTLGFGMVGFVDDFIKVKLKRSLGLTPMQKIAPQFVISLALSIWAYKFVGGGLRVPFTNIVWDLGIWYVPVMVFILVGTVNSANLLDGLDGLLGGCAMIDFATLAMILPGISTLMVGDLGGNMNLMLVCGSCAGALLGFLRFNGHPAGVFMGDCGSFLIGGAIAGVCMCSGLALYLPIIALAMFVSSASDIIQVGWFKFTKKKYGAGRRVFRMAPLHHHFELGGMPETKVVAMYRIVTAALCLLCLSYFVAW